ncbi:MAG: DUF998 domain-containing protein [Actinobacteria bacterium]|nr:DUF998 domain-containing protein [Actinomycetota bacterium]
MTETLLIVGMAAAVVFVAVFLIEGALRPGYDPTYHTVSQLSVGDRGWIQIANFLLMGVAMFAFAVGVNRTLNAAIGAVLLAVFGLGAIASGVFVTDPMRGYPPGAPTGAAASVTLHSKLHDAVAPPMFLAIFGACLTLAGRLDGPWRLYTVLTAIVGLALTIGTALAYQRDAANLGLIQRALLLVYWSWIVLLGIHLL